MPFIEGWPHVRSCLLEGFHCIEIKLTMPFACRCQCGHCVAVDMNRESCTVLLRARQSCTEEGRKWK